MGRRGCFKCGNLGHNADQCTSGERLCFNCKLPGHQSMECREPRTNSTKQCFECQAIGHVQSECPTLHKSQQLCYNCKEPGHLQRDCRYQAAASGGPDSVPHVRSAYGTSTGGRPPYSNSQQTCYNCGGPNHFARDCQARSTKRYAYGQTGHISREFNERKPPTTGDRATGTHYQSVEPNSTADLAESSVKLEPDTQSAPDATLSPGQ